MTYVEALNIAIEAVDNEEVSEKLTALKGQIAKKKGSSKPTKRQKENEELKSAILDILGEEGMTATEILKSLNDADLTIQRVSGNLAKMVKDDKTVCKEIVKGKAMFRLA